MKSHTTRKQAEEYSKDYVYHGLFDKHSINSNSGTHWAALRIEANKSIDYTRITDPNIWKRKCQWDDTRLPEKLKNRLTKRIEEADALNAQE